MTVCEYSRVVINDRLRKVWHCRCHGVRMQGKRLPAKARISQRIRRAYVTGGATGGVIAIKKDFKCDLKLAWRVIKAWRINPMLSFKEASNEASSKGR